MKTIIAALCCLFLVVAMVQLTSCDSAVAEPQGYINKDLSEQMDALSVYQNQIGEDLRKGNPKDAISMVNGMDSVLLLITERLNNHHNLQKPFEHYYKRKLESPIEDLRNAVENDNLADANKHYKILVNRCNSCHKEHGVEERAHE
jgi:hypothetical protein